MNSNLTMKDNLKIIGAEALYLLASAVIAGIAAHVQMIGRIYEGDYSGFIFSGSNYRYNGFFYIIRHTKLADILRTSKQEIGIRSMSLSVRYHQMIKLA